MSLPQEVHIVPSLTVTVEHTEPTIPPPAAMPFDELGPWLADHPDLREIALKLVADVVGSTADVDDTAHEALVPHDDDAVEEDVSALDVDEDVEDDPSLDCAGESEPDTSTELAASAELTELLVSDEEGQVAPARSTAVADIGRRTLTLHRTMRSGNAVRFEGDVVLFGDLNPGAEIIAAGNILVLGRLKGLAHAGCLGDVEAFILGFDLSPTQLRIARHIAIPPKRGAGRTGIEPEIARIADEEISIEPYGTRFFRQAGA